MDPDLDALVVAFDLKPLPDEGGWFRQTWSSPEPAPGGGPLGTAIVALFVRTPSGFSALHRLRSPEVWHFYRGDAFELLLLHPDGHAEERMLGPGGEVQLVVDAGVWMGGCVAEGGRYSITGATMAPGYTSDGFELGDRDDLVARYPTHAARIVQLTRYVPG